MPTMQQQQPRTMAWTWTLLALCCATVCAEQRYAYTGKSTLKTCWMETLPGHGPFKVSGLCYNTALAACYKDPRPHKLIVDEQAKASGTCKGLFKCCPTGSQGQVTYHQVRTESCGHESGKGICLDISRYSCYADDTYRFRAHFVSGKCTGPSEVKCCMSGNFKVAPCADSSYLGGNARCADTTKATCVMGNFLSSGTKCYGAGANIKCCTSGRTRKISAAAPTPAPTPESTYAGPAM